MSVPRFYWERAGMWLEIYDRHYSARDAVVIVKNGDPNLADIIVKELNLENPPCSA